MCCFGCSWWDTFLAFMVTVFIFMSKKLTKDTNTEMVAKVTRYLAYFIAFFAFTRAVKVFHKNEYLLVL